MPQEPEPETIYAIRRLDGELMFGEYGWVATDGPNDWDPAQEEESGPTCDGPAQYWGLCEAHAREDDPEYFDD